MPSDICCVSEPCFSIPAPIKRRCFAPVIAKSYPIRIIIQFSRYSNKVFHLFPLGRAKLSGVFEKIFCFAKEPFTHLDKGGRNAHPFSGFFSKIFLRKNFTLHLFGITKPNDTLFHRKNKKIFFRLRVLYFACSEKALHLFPLGEAKCTP